MWKLIPILFLTGCVSISTESYFVVEKRDCLIERQFEFKETNFESSVEITQCVQYKNSSTYYQKFPYREVPYEHLTFYPSGTIVIKQEYRHLYKGESRG